MMKSLVKKHTKIGGGADAMQSLVKDMVEVEGVKALLEAERTYRIPGSAENSLKEAYRSVELLKDDKDRQDKYQVALALTAELELESKAKNSLKRAMDLLDLAEEVKAGTARIGAMKARVLKAQGKLKAAIGILEPFGDGPRPMCTLNGMDFFHLGRAWGDMGAEDPYPKKAEKLLSAAWARGAGADASYALGQMLEQTYVEKAQATYQWGPTHGEKTAYDEAVDYYKKAARENRRDARPPFRLGLLAEDGYMQKVLFGLGGSPPVSEGEGDLNSEVAQVSGTKTWSASAMDEEILALARKHGVVEESPEVSALLQSLTAEHKLLTEAQDRDAAETIMVLYHFKARQLIAEGGTPVGRANKVDPPLREAWQCYTEALAVDKKCGPDVHLHLARAQRWMGMGDKAVITLNECLETFPGNAACLMYLALCKRPPEEDVSCPPAIWEARAAVMDCVAESQRLGSALPCSCLAKEVLAPYNPDLLSVVVAITAEYNRQEDFMMARETALPFITMLPEVLLQLGNTGVAPLELTASLQNLQRHYLSALFAIGTPDAIDECLPTYDHIFNSYKETCSAPGCAVEVLKRFVKVCEAAAKAMKHSTVAHARLGTAILIRVTSDPHFSKQSQKKPREKELKVAEKELRLALELEGQPLEVVEESAESAPEAAPAAAAPAPAKQAVDDDFDMEEEPAKEPKTPTATKKGSTPAATPTTGRAPRASIMGVPPSTGKRASIFMGGTPPPTLAEPGAPETPKQTYTPMKVAESKEGRVNEKSFLARIELSTCLRELEGNSRGMLAVKLSDKARGEALALLRECIQMDIKNVDNYVLLGEVLFPHNAKEALEEMSQYPPPEGPPTFQDSFLHVELVRLAFKHAESEGRESAMYYSPTVERSLVTAGKVLGIEGISKYLDTLDSKGKYKLCKKVYCGIMDRAPNDEEIQPFLKQKGWDV